MENLFTTDKIRLRSGIYMDPLNPKIDDINIEDIAHGLSFQCRFGGHTKTFYPISEHCIWVLLHCPPDLQLAALLHDASEAYLLDIPSPVKSRIPGYKEAEDNLMKLIAEKFQFQYPLDPIVKDEDMKALQWEWNKFVIGDGGYMGTYQPGTSKDAFLAYFNVFKK